MSIKSKCKHNWHYVGAETYERICSKQGVIIYEGCKIDTQWATFICDKCGKTKKILVEGILNKVILNKSYRETLLNKMDREEL